MVDDDENTMGNGHSRTLSSAPTGDAAVLGRQIAVLAVSGRMSGLDQEASQPGIPLTSLATETLAPAFIIARADPGPRGKVASRRKLAHIQTDFCQDPLGRSFTDPRNSSKQFDGFGPTEWFSCSATGKRGGSLDGPLHILIPVSLHLLCPRFPLVSRAHLLADRVVPNHLAACARGCRHSRLFDWFCPLFFGLGAGWLLCACISISPRVAQRENLRRKQEEKRLKSIYFSQMKYIEAL
jgi:hypothetical protein